MLTFTSLHCILHRSTTAWRAVFQCHTDRNLPMQTNGDRGNQLATKNNCKVVFIAASYTSLQQILRQ